MTLSLGEFVSASEGTCTHTQLCVRACVSKNACVSVVKAYAFPDVLKCVPRLKHSVWEGENDTSTSSSPGLFRHTCSF